MLIAEVSLNLDLPIEDILIHNFKEHENGIWEYEIMDPNSPEERLVEETVFHKYEDGYRTLLIKVLLLLEGKCTERKLNKDLREIRKGYQQGGNYES